MNFLRVALFGFPMVLNPMFFTFYGGHFSPVVGYLDNEDLVWHTCCVASSVVQCSHDDRLQSSM